MAKIKSVLDSSGNVFSDLNLADAEELNAKAKLGAALVKLLHSDGRTQEHLANALGITQPKVSALLRYKFDGFSAEKLMVFFVKLNQAVEISYAPVIAPQASAIFVCARRDRNARSSPGFQGRDEEQYLLALRIKPGTVSQPLPRIYAS